MQTLFYQTLHISLTGLTLLAVRKAGGQKLHLQVRTILWCLFFAACIIPASKFSTPLGVIDNTAATNEDTFFSDSIDSAYNNTGNKTAKKNQYIVTDNNFDENITEAEQRNNTYVKSRTPVFLARMEKPVICLYILGAMVVGSFLYYVI